MALRLNPDSTMSPREGRGDPYTYKYLRGMSAWYGGVVGIHGIPDSRHVIQTSCLQCMPRLKSLRHVAMKL